MQPVQAVPDNDAEEYSLIWVKDEEMIKPVRVETGISDGSDVEILSGLNEGDEVVISMTASADIEKAEKTTSSPFMPQRPGRPN